MDKTKKIIIDVIPLVRLPLSRSPHFSYLSEKKIPIGSLVSIQFLKRNIKGIVIGFRQDFHRLGNIQLKEISSIISESFVDQKQLELARFISEYYFSPLGIVLKSFVPRITKERKKEKIFEKIFPKEITLTGEQKKAIDEIAKNQKPKTKNYLLFGPASSGKTEIYIESIKNLRADEQALVLLPELTLTPQAIERYSAHFSPDQTVVLNSQIAKGAFYSGWKKIKNGEAKLIIGSRMAVFAPFKNLKLIVVDEEQDMSFKQWDMNPRYDARIASQKLAEIHNAKIIFGSATPRVETYFSAQKKLFHMLRLSRLKNSPQTKIELVDLRKEYWENKKTFQSQSRPLLTRKLQAEIAFALKNKFQTILFINRQGMSLFSVCIKCKNVLKCPKCERALIYDQSGNYKCLHCNYKTSIIPQCPKCQGMVFNNIGAGTQKIEREIANIFPSARILRADQSTTKAQRSQEKIYSDFSRGKADILIGTQMISKGWDLPNVALIGIIDADNLFSHPDFFAQEKAYSMIMQVIGRTSRTDSKIPGTALIQTFNPLLEIFKNIAEGNFEKFYEKELKEKKSLGLPPFGKLIKLIYQDTAEKKVQAEAQRVYEILSKKILKNIKYTEPQNAFVPKIRNRYRQQIIIQIKNNKPMPEYLKNCLTSLPAGWIIDVDPISII